MSATVFDNALRFQVSSRSRPGESHMVDLGAYSGQGRCDCLDFCTRVEKYLARGYTPEKVWQEGWIKKLREYQPTIDDVLSCKHLIDARAEFARMTIRALVKAGEINGRKQ